jgi:hypothetical protein
MGPKIGITVIIVTLAALLAPAAAAGTAWYAAPTGQGSGDCTSAANACLLGSAVATAAAGDTVYVLGNLGEYDLGANTVDPGSKVLHLIGTNGIPRLIANGTAPVLNLSAASSSATGFYLENDGDGDGLFVSPVYGSGGFSIDRMHVKTTGAMTSHTCFLGGGVTLTNSVCWQANTSTSTGAISTEFTNTIRNDVAWQSGAGVAVQSAGVYGDADLTVVNTIARATGAGGHDLGTFTSGSFRATINIRYSNFRTTAFQGSGSGGHVETSTTDQHAGPVLVSPLAGNFRERATSPTINAGLTAPANGAFDLAGKPRTANGRTDIGAYELRLRPPRHTRITHATVRKRKHSATFRFTATGTVKGFQCSLVRNTAGSKPHFTPCRSPKTYTRLKNKRYTFEVRAVNLAGPDRVPAKRSFFG